MTADERGQQLMRVPMNQLPPVALNYARHLCQKYGACCEVYLTAYVQYANVVEGLEIEDDGYKPVMPEDIQWFADATKCGHY